MKPELRMTMNDVRKAGEDWGFNCGPAAICAALQKTPDEVRPYLGDFEQKGHTNPSLMRKILDTMGVQYSWRAFLGSPPKDDPKMWPRLGLVRVQWDGPWCGNNVPIRARYRHTHWVAFCGETNEVLDVNAVAFNVGWMPFTKWEQELVPWLLRECEKKATGAWWVTDVAVLAS
jgi:hypothetical protein